MRQKIFEYIVNYITEHGYPPTVREIGKGVGLQSTSSVYIHLQRLLDDGLIESDMPGAPRAIRVPGYEFVKKKP